MRGWIEEGWREGGKKGAWWRGDLLERGSVLLVMALHSLFIVPRCAGWGRDRSRGRPVWLRGAGAVTAVTAAAALRAVMQPLCVLLCDL